MKQQPPPFLLGRALLRQSSPTMPTPIAPSISATPRKLTWAFVWQHPAHVLGLGLGAGLAPKAPGTAGTLLGWALFLPLQWALPVWAQGVAVAATVAVAWWACTITARNLHQPDPGCVVWDEVAAFWLVLWLLPPAGTPLFSSVHWAWQVAAFALFRYFDAVKPGPVRWADSVFKGGGWRGGWGIVFDDVVAAFCTLLSLALMQHLRLLWLA